MKIRVHYTWIFVFGLVAAIVTTQFSEDYLLWQKIVLGMVVALLFLAVTALREILLGTTSVRSELPIGKITLFAFGGVYQEAGEKIVNAHWPLIYLARYFSNFLTAVIFYGLYATFTNAGFMTAAGLAQWLAYIYALLFLLHFIPGFPLDGGKILRLLLWRSGGRSGGDYYKATYTASLTGYIMGFFLIFIGVLIFIIIQQWIICSLIVAVGWFIEIAAGNSLRKVRTLMVLQNIRARDVMTREYPVMSAQMKIGQLVRENILVKGWQYVIVADEAKLKGILILKQIRAVPGRLWNSLSVGEIMTPAERLATAHPEDGAATLLEQMELLAVDYIPVLEGEKVSGVVTRPALVNLLKTRARLGA